MPLQKHCVTQSTKEKLLALLFLWVTWEDSNLVRIFTFLVPNVVSKNMSQPSSITIVKKWLVTWLFSSLYRLTPSRFPFNMKSRLNKNDHLSALSWNFFLQKKIKEISRPKVVWKGNVLTRQDKIENTFEVSISRWTKMCDMSQKAIFIMCSF